MRGLREDQDYQEISQPSPRVFVEGCDAIDKTSTRRCNTLVMGVAAYRKSVSVWQMQYLTVPPPSCLTSLCVVSDYDLNS